MMADARAGHSELEVSNFGPIAEAKIQLRPLTVFVGPSNTGKSYLAMLLYALHRFFKTEAAGFGSWRSELMGRPFAAWSWRAGTDFSNIDTGALRAFMHHLEEWVGRQGGQGEDSVPVPEALASSLRPVFGSLQELADGLDAEIRRCFGVGDTRQLIRRPSRKGISVCLRRYARSTAGTLRPFEYGFSAKGPQPAFGASIPDDVTLRAGGDLRELHRRYSIVGSVENELGSSRYLSLAIGNLWSSVCAYILGDVSRPAHYLPADRTGVMHAHRVVVRSLIEGAPTAAFRPTSPAMPALSGVMADFLGRLIEMDDLPKSSTGRNRRLVKGLEENVLAGAIDVRRSEIGYPHFLYTPRGWRNSDALPLMNASSMVSELAPVVLFLRRVVAPGDLLIIEEPESHLHPAMQTEFARQLAHVVKAGIRVLVTTHSEWILDQFANVVRLSELPKEKRGGLAGADAALRPDQFGAWLFKQKKRPKGSVVEEIRIDPEAGGLLSDYGDVAEQLYNTWTEIGNRAVDSIGVGG